MQSLITLTRSSPHTWKGRPLTWMQWSGKEELWTHSDGVDTPDDNTNLTDGSSETLTVLEARQVCPVLNQCTLIYEELLTLGGSSPVSSWRKPRIPYSLPWINFFTSAGKHLNVPTNAHSSLWALIILYYLNCKLRHFHMVKCDKSAFLSSEFTLPASHDLSVSLQSFLSCFFGEKLNKSFPRVPSCIVCDDGDAVFHDVQIWKIKRKKFNFQKCSNCFHFLLLIIRWNCSYVCQLKVASRGGDYVRNLKKTEQCQPQWRRRGDLWAAPPHRQQELLLLS